MIPEFEFITIWLTETVMHGTAILVVAVAWLSWTRQPARRMPVAWGAMAGLAALTVLPALPWWPQIALPVWQNAFALPAQATSRLTANHRPIETDATKTNAEQVSAHADVAIFPPDENATTELAFAQGLEVESVGTDSVAEAVSTPLDDPRDVNIASDDKTSIALHPVPASAAADWPTRLLSWRATTAGAWFAGAVLVTIWIAAGAWRTQRLYRRSHDAPRWVHDELRRIVPAYRRQPRTRVSHDVTAALAYGAVRPVILLRDPHVYDARPEPGERRGTCAALAHEYAHIAHGDLWLLALERMLLPVYFAHPLFWVLRRWIRRDQELLADAAAAAESPVDYAEALLEWAKSAPAARAPRFSAALPLWNSPSHLKRRIEMLLDARQPIARHASRLWQGTVLTTIFAFVIGVSLVTFRPQPDVAHAADQPASERPALEQSGGAASFTSTAANRGGDTAANAPGKPAERDSTGKPRANLPADDMAARAEEYPQASERYRVQINITMFQVDHEKLAEAGLMTLRRLTDETCVSINEPRAADDLFGVHTSTECAEKLVAALTAHEAVKLDTKRGLQSTFDIRPNDKALVSGFKYEPARLTLQLEAKLAHPANRGVLHVRLNVIGEQRPKKDLRTNADRGLEISSARKIGFASFLKAGQSLLIVDDSNNLESSVETDQVSLTIVSATSVTEIPVDQPQAVIAAAKNTSRDLSKAAIDTAIADAADRDADLKIERAEEEAIRAKDQYESSQNLVKKGLAKVSQAEADLLAWESAKLSLEAAKRRIIGPKEDVERLLKLIRALEEELRLLRAKTESKEAAPAPRKVEGTTTTVERQLLMLDVKEAELEEAAAREAYLAARQLKSTDATSAAEVEDRLAAWRKAKIWLERARLRAELGERPQAAVTFTDATDDAAGNAASLAEKLRQLEAEEAQLDFEAAKQAYGLGLKMHADGVLSSTALAARKLRFQKAVIAKERMELRLKSVQPPAADLKNQSSQSDRRVETIEMQNANIESLELQLKAARNQLNSQRTFFLNAFNRETTPHPNGFTDGFQFSMPLGLRHSLSQIRNTELRLAQAKNMLATQLIESGNGE